MNKKLPKNVFVRWEDAGNDEPFLTAAETAEDHAEIGERYRVGVYRLVDTVEVTAPPTAKIIKTRR